MCADVLCHSNSVSVIERVSVMERVAIIEGAYYYIHVNTCIHVCT